MSNTVLSGAAKGHCAVLLLAVYHTRSPRIVLGDFFNKKNGMKMTLQILILALAITLPMPAHALDGTDLLPGTACTVNKAMTMTANPHGIGGYILTCEDNKWVATLTADTPTLPDQVATKKYIDEHISVLKTHTYINPTTHTNLGNERPILISTMQPLNRGPFAAALCSQLSNGAYVTGKFSKMRNVHPAKIYNPNEQITYNCTGECIGEESGNQYAWYDRGDFLVSQAFYLNYTPPSPINSNAPEISTRHCHNFQAGNLGTININQECMAGVTSSRNSLSGITAPNYTSGLVIEELICWAN